MATREEKMDSFSDEEMEEEEEVQQQEVFVPGKTEHDGEELEFDPSAYIFLHQLQAGAPCLSFDIIPDHHGNGREEFPLSCYIASGTERGQPNFINVMKLHNITKTQESENEDSDEESDDEDDNPELNLVTMEHHGGVNRIRVANIGDKIYTATWSDKGSVYISDITALTDVVDDPMKIANQSNYKKNTAHSVKAHTTEGFAIDWSRPAEGWLASGDCNGAIYISQPANGGWTSSKCSFVGHTASVEDLQWSPNENNVFASCSVDRSIRIWSTQQKPEKANILTVPEAHSRDINVIHWNPSEPQLLASGGDDGIIKIWDLRMFRNQPVCAQADFSLHTQPITSVEWNPNDSGVLAASGSDDQITIWDFSIEVEEKASDDGVDVPVQLLFQHCGQTDIKEVHWHAQLPGVLISTALNNFNVFRTISV